jgi:hypothetical protein
MTNADKINIDKVEKMAKPIPSTPILSGKDAERFLENMLKEQTNPDPKRIAFLKEAREDFKKFTIVY